MTPDGLLDGQVTLTVVGLDQLIKLPSGSKRCMNQQLAQRGAAWTRSCHGLDRILPGLGGAVRGNSGTIAAVGIAMLGHRPNWKARRLVAVPLKFSAGMVSLGPLQVGRMRAVVLIKAPSLRRARQLRRSNPSEIAPAGVAPTSQ